MAKGLDYVINLLNGNFGGVDKAKNEIDGLDRKLNNTKNLFGKLFELNQVGDFIGHIRSITDSITGTADELIEVRGQFQGFEKLLVNQLGPAGMAVFADIKQFAKETPFEVDNLTESFIKLQGSGFNPTMDKMQQLGDFAAVKMKNIDQLVEAVLDAQSGEFERLKEFGVRASKAGDQVTFTYQGVAKTMKMSQANVEDYLLSLGKMPGVYGSMAAMAETFIGQESNNSDKLTQYKDKLGNQLEPVLTRYIQLKGQAIDKMEAFTDALMQVPKWLQENETGLKAVGVGLGIAAAGAALFGVYQLALAAPLAITNSLIWLQVTAQWALNAAMTANPVGLVIAGVALLGAGLYYAYQKSETFRAALSGLIEVGKVIMDVFVGVGKTILGALTLDPAMIKSGFQQAGKAVADIQSQGLGNIFDKGYNSSIAETRKTEKEKAAEEKQKEAVAPMTGKAIVPAKGQTAGAAATGTGTSKNQSISNESVAAGKSVKNITITIQTLIKEFNQTVNNLKGTDGYELKRLITETLMGAVRDVEIMAE